MHIFETLGDMGLQIYMVYSESTLVSAVEKCEWVRFGSTWTGVHWGMTGLIWPFWVWCVGVHYQMKFWLFVSGSDVPTHCGLFVLNEDR